MYDNIMDEMIQKYEEIVMRHNDIKKQHEQLEKDINNFYNYLFSIRELKQSEKNKT